MTPTQSAERSGLGRSHRLADDTRRVPVSNSPANSACWYWSTLAVITGSLAGPHAGLLGQSAPDQRPGALPALHHDRPLRPKGRVIGSFALERRIIVNYDDFAPVLRQAVISIEDKNFDSHWGINVFRIAGAAGTTCAPTAAPRELPRSPCSWRAIFSSPPTAPPPARSQEAYLAIQIERAFTKEQIFTLYGNQIYLGSGMYGFEAASQFYFSKHAKDLNLTEAALLAGLPKGPAAYSPLLNPEKALRRRNLVLSEMESDGVITHAAGRAGAQAPLGLHISQPEMSVAPWFQEEVRRELEKRFGAEQVHEAGLRVDTTLDLDLQKTANKAVADGLAAYERRHGWKGKLENVLARRHRH